MTIGQIKALAQDDNTINMDSRSILSCLDLFSGNETLESQFSRLTEFGQLTLLSMARESAIIESCSGTLSGLPNVDLSVSLIENPFHLETSRLG